MDVEPRQSESVWLQLTVEARSIAAHLVRPDDIEDVVQDACLRVLQRYRGSFAQFATSDHRRGYVRAIIKHLAVDRRRALARIPTILPLEASHGATDPCELSDPSRQLRMREWVMNQIVQLPSQQARVIQIVLSGEPGIKAISRRAGLGPSDVRRTLTAAAARLRKLACNRPPPLTFNA